MDVLQLESVSKRYGPRPVLNEVSLTLRPREVLALCGASGAGKTTLLRIVSGLCHFDRGEVAISGHRVRAQASYPSRLYGQIGMVSQDPHLFPHMTALGNVTLALREFKRLTRRQAQERGMVELERMGVASLAHQYPSTLSGGERQRVAIARALAVDPLVLLLDEPTAHLDPSRVVEVRERILQLAANGATMMIVTHNIEFARQAAASFALLQQGTCRSSEDPAILDDPGRWLGGLS